MDPLNLVLKVKWDVYLLPDALVDILLKIAGHGRRPDQRVDVKSY